MPPPLTVRAWIFDYPCRDHYASIAGLRSVGGILRAAITASICQWLFGKLAIKAEALVMTGLIERHRAEMELEQQQAAAQNATARSTAAQNAMAQMLWPKCPGRFTAQQPHDDIKQHPSATDRHQFAIEPISQAKNVSEEDQITAHLPLVRSPSNALAASFSSR